MPFLGWLPEVDRGLVLLTKISAMPRAIRSRPHCSLEKPLPDRPVNPGSLVWALVLAGAVGVSELAALAIAVTVFLA